MPVLPDIPKVALEVVGDHSAEREGFLSLRRTELVVVHADRTRSAPLRYDIVERRALDAAVIAAHHIDHDVPHVYLRSAVRPPAALRRSEPLSSGQLWELPAGLIEPGEAPAAAAARELEEELGFRIAPEDLQPLGGWAFPAPGFIGEVHWFFHARVDARSREEPAGDGSPLEEHPLIISVPLDDAIAACTAGEIRDAKTELALHRLANVFG